MRVSLLIAAHNEGEALWKTVRACVESTNQQQTEIIIANDASRDGSIEEVQLQFPQARVVSHARRLGVSPTRHLATEEAEGDIFIFLDAHTNPDFGSLKRLAEDVELLQGNAIVTPCVAALDTVQWVNSRHQRGHGYAVDLETFYTQWLGLNQMKIREEGGRLFYESPALMGCVFAISRSLYFELRGFDVEMREWGVEDLDLGMKSWLSGYPILHDPQAVVGHRFRSSFDNYSVHAAQVLANQLRFARKHFTSAVWNQWVEACRLHSDGTLAEHPEGLWAYAWQLFEAGRSHVEHERRFLQGRRIHDEFWFADYFGLNWPRLNQPDTSSLTECRYNSPRAI